MEMHHFGIVMCGLDGKESDNSKDLEEEREWIWSFDFFLFFLYFMVTWPPPTCSFYLYQWYLFPFTKEAE